MAGILAGNRFVSGNKFAGVPPHIEKLARTLQEKGLAVSTAGAISLAMSISDVESPPARYPDDPERIASRERPRRSPAGIANLNPSECGPPVSHLNPGRKPGRIENVPEISRQQPERPKPRGAPAVFLHEPGVSAASVREAASRKPEQREKPSEQSDIINDDKAVREILGQDDRQIYGEPKTGEGQRPAAKEEPVIKPAEPAPKPAQQQSQNPFQQGARGRGLTKEEAEMTDITRIFRFGRR